PRYGARPARPRPPPPRPRPGRPAPGWSSAPAPPTRVASALLPRPGRPGHPGRHPDRRPGAGSALHGEVVHQAPGPAQPHAEPVTRGVAVAERPVEVRDARPLVDEGQPQPGHPRRTDRGDLHPAAAAVHQGVAGQLTGGGDQLRLVHQPEPEPGRGLPHMLAHPHQVHVRPDGQARLHARRRVHHAPSPRQPAGPDSTTGWESISNATSVFSAVRRPGSVRPSSTRVIATAGRIPATTVRAASSSVCAAISASTRPRKESTISTPEMSMTTPVTPLRTMVSDRSCCSCCAVLSYRSPWRVTSRMSPSRSTGTVACPATAREGSWITVGPHPSGTRSRC